MCGVRDLVRTETNEERFRSCSGCRKSGAPPAGHEMNAQFKVPFIGPAFNSSQPTPL